MADELRIGLAELLRKAMIKATRTSSRRASGCSRRRSWRWRSRSTWARGATSGPPSAGTAQRLPGTDLGYAGGGGRAQGAQGEGCELLPLAAGAQKAGRAGALCGGPGGLRARGLHAQGRRVGEGFGHDGHLQEPGVRALRGARRGGRALPQSRPLEGPYPYVWLDATYVKAARTGGWPRWRW